MPENSAAWLVRKYGPLEVGPAPYPAPGAKEIVVRNHAVGINPVDWLIPIIGGVAYPWLTYPAVVGTDVAGEVVEVGAGVTRFQVGDRVLGHAVGAEKNRNAAAEGAFQLYPVLLEHMTSAIPADLPYEQAAVLPLGLSTAACGLFQQDLLALRLPGTGSDAAKETVLVWGGSTSVGSNAIQLAVAAGYDVFTTASPRNFDYVRTLGASQVFDYRSPTVIDDVVKALASTTLAGTIAIGTGSSGPCLAIVRATNGRKFIATASTEVSFAGVAGKRFRLLRLLPLMARFGGSAALLLVKSRRAKVTTKSIWGGTLKDNEVGPAMYADFLPDALADGRYRPAPEPLVVGTGLDSIHGGFDTQRQGVSARKVVVTL